MEVPIGVKQAVLAIWATIAISAVGSAISVRLGYTSQGEFAFTLIMYVLLCILPYKLNNGSNPARYVFFVLSAMSFILLLAGGIKLSKPDAISAFIQTPLTCFAIYRLLQQQANVWFATSRSSSTGRNAP